MAIGFAAGLLMTAAIPAYACDGIPWKTDSFERTSVDEPIQTVIGAVLKANGQQVSFRKEVKGTVSAQFNNMPLQGVFNQLMAENGLDCSFEPKTNMVTIAALTTQTFVSIGQVSPAAIHDAVRDFGLAGNVVFNKDTNTALIKGTAEQVKLLKDLVADMVTNAKTAGEGRVSDNTEASAAAAARRAFAEAREAEDKSLAKTKALEGLLNQQIKVIPLRYASVGPTVKKFFDQSVTIPGIEETINKLLGDPNALSKNLPKEQADLMHEMAGPLALSRPVVSADTRTNSVIVRGTPEAIIQVADLVKQLDRPVPLIEIEVIIVKAQEGFSQSLGVNWSGGQNMGTNSGNNNNSYGISSGIAPSSIYNPVIAPAQQTIPVTGANGTTVSTATTSSTAAVPLINALNYLPGMSTAQSVVAGFIMQNKQSVLQAQIQAAEADSRAQTIASPRVVTMNNIAAKMSKQDSLFIPIQGAAGSTGTMKQIDAGVILDILPSVILPQDTAQIPLIKLNITASNTVPTVAPGATSVEVSGNVVTTEVMIPNQTTFVLGGLLDDARTKSSAGIPGLRSIPLFGALFDTSNDTDALDETIFFITPKVIMPDEIAPADVATRRYMHDRQDSLSETSKELEQTAKYLGRKPKIDNAE